MPTGTARTRAVQAAFRQNESRGGAQGSQIDRIGLGRERRITLHRVPRPRGGQPPSRTNVVRRMDVRSGNSSSRYSLPRACAIAP